MEIRELFLQELERLAGEDFQRKKYLVAVSGGADSTIAATFFHECGLSFAMAHCNFHLRGADSNHDMHFVQQLAEQRQVPLFLREFDTPTLQRNSGKSVEMIARELRYAWFDEIAHDYDFIVTAHHSTDAAETMLLNLCRGTGLKGLCSIPPKNGKIIRPMLPFTAQEIRQYADYHHIAYVEDVTNRDEKIARNRIRHHVIPQLETINPQYLHTNAHSRLILHRQYAYYQKHIQNDIQKLVSMHGEQCRIDREKLAKSEDKELILYEILNNFGFASDTIEQLATDKIFQTGKCFHSETHILLIDREYLLIQPKKDHDARAIVLHNLADLQSYFDIEELEYQRNMVFEKDPHTLYIPKEKLTFPLEIRTWRPGDYFYPFGGKGRKKVSDFFTDHKIDRFTKEQIRLLCKDDQIIWIIGYRSDERWKVTEKNQQYYLIRSKNN